MFLLEIYHVPLASVAAPPPPLPPSLYVKNGPRFVSLELNQYKEFYYGAPKIIGVVKLFNILKPVSYSTVVIDYQISVVMFFCGNRLNRVPNFNEAIIYVKEEIIN